MNSAIGIDPDSTTSGLCVIRPNGVFVLELIRAKGKTAEKRLPYMAAALLDIVPLCYFDLAQPGQGLDPVCAVERQHIRPVERNPNSMMPVQAVFGAVVAAMVERKVRPERIYTPIPSEWKGSITKEAHHPRILARADLELDGHEFSHIPASLRHHVVDAVGLALWAKDKYEREEARQARLRRLGR